MTTVKRIQAGQYSVSDGRFIVHGISGWFVITSDGQQEFGPLTSLTASEEYISTGKPPLGLENISPKQGRRKVKKEFNTYLAYDARNGNYWPIVMCFSILVVVAIYLSFR